MARASGIAFAEVETWLERILAAPAEARPALLASCTDEALRAELGMLLAGSGGEGPLDRAPASLALEALRHGAQMRSRAGTTMGAYRLIDLLGEGGMATVWRAARSDGAIDREVAVKCLRIGLATPELHARFLREQQILARLTHPHIARLYDAGVSADGVPYLVMERIDGVPITRWCEEHALGLRARLELFRKVLDAVAFAHRNLTVHRDLKPANILVGPEGAPKLLDFGIAKLLDADAESTRTQTRALTPGYAAPEQFDGGVITTATDVYALGVILCELLSGCRPAAANAGEANPPSVLVLAPGADPLSPARSRGFAGAGSLARALHGDLDTLVATALQRDPARRYAGATAFDEDIERYLQRRPLRARRDSLGYRVRKFARRNWLALSATGAVIIALGAGIGLALWQAEQARRSAARAEAVQNFLLSVFETAHAGPRADALLTTHDVVERAARQLEGQFAGDPATAAQLRLALGRVYRKMGLLDQALPLLTDAVAAARARGTPLELADALEALGHADNDALRFAEAESAFSEALQLRRAENSPPQSEAQALAGLGEAQTYAGKVDPALATLQLGLARSDEAPDADPALRQRLLNSFAVALRRAGRPDAAIAAADEAVANARAGFGPHSHEAASALSVLGSIERRFGHLEDAERALRETVAIDQEIHQPVPAHLHNLGVLLRDLGAYDEAERVLRDALAAQTADLGPDHPAVGNYQKELGLILLSLGREAEAEALLRQALEHARKGYDARAPEVADKELDLANALLARAEVAQARQFHLDVIETASMPGAGRLRLRALALGGLSRDDAAADDLPHAAQLAHEALAAAQPGDTLEPQEQVAFELDVGEVLLAAGELADAGLVLRAAETRASGVFPDDHPLHARALLDLARLAHSRGDPRLAAQFLERSLAILRERLPQQHPLRDGAERLQLELGPAITR